MAGAKLSQQERAELVELYFLARTALSGQGDSKYERMAWAANAFEKKHPEWPSIKTYKELDYALALQ